MPEPDRPKMSPATIRRIAEEQARLPLSDAGAAALVDLVNGLQAFAAEVVARPRAGVEPVIAFESEDWTND